MLSIICTSKNWLWHNDYDLLYELFVLYDFAYFAVVHNICIQRSSQKGNAYMW